MAAAAAHDPEPCGPPEIASHSGPKEPESPKHCWSRRFDARPPRKSVHKPSKPGAIEIISLLPVAARVGSYVSHERRAGREPIFDLSGIDLHPPDPGPVAGVPLGGIGGGCISRGWRGDFNRWSLWPGRYKHGVNLANQFSIRACPVNGSKKEARSTILSIPQRSKKNKSAIRNWDSTLNPTKCTYYGLFPRAWTFYEWNNIKIVCKQVSPVIPHDYATTSLPASAFVYTIENTGTEALDISMMFSFQNGDGGPGDSMGGHSNVKFSREPVDGHPEVDLANAKTPSDGSGGGGGEGKKKKCTIKGVEMHHLHRTRVVFDPNNEDTLRRGGGGGGLCQGPEAICVAGQPQQYDEDQTSHSDKESLSSQAEERRRSSTVENGSFSVPIRMGQVFTDKLTFGIAALDVEDEVNVSVCETFETNFRTDHGASANELWSNFSQYGNLDKMSNNVAVDPKTGSKKGSTIGSAVCQQFATPLQPGEARQLTFSLCWDSPNITFGSGKTLPRRYTRFFGTSGNSAQALCAHTLGRRLAWENAIDAWQRPILDNDHLPSFYKCLLFNELYFLVDGGTLWTDSKKGVSNHKIDSFEDKEDQKLAIKNADHPLLTIGCDQRSVGAKGDGDQEDIGQFLYLEGHEYLMYNTYDVHFYASFALVSLWPQLQLSLQRDFALAVMQKDTRTIRRLLGNGGRAPRKIAGAVPHDLGSPCEEPWTKVNVYNFQDVSRWKDLGPKFVLTVLRDYEVTQSKQFVATVFPTIAHVMSAVAKNDKDGDGLIENSGFPDQTYDIWSVSGPSAYTGGLWIAALAASLKMANVVEEAALMKSEEGSGLALGGVASEGLIALSAAVKATYTPMLEKAKEAYDEKLWNGTYFNYDASGDRNSDSVMSDQLAGQWYAGACELEPIVETHKAAQALRTVYHYNVCNYEKGRRGCVNGMKPASTKHPNGHVDNNCMQSREVWTGTTYGVAACMLQEFGTEFDRSKVENEKKKKSLVATRLAESSRGGGGGAVKAASSKKDGEGVSLWDAAFGTIRGMWVSGWNELGYWYATPEGWEASGNYRSLGYMRPLSVWAMQYAIEKNSLLEKRQQSVDEESSKTKE